MFSSPIVLFWFRRDLRVEDNHGLFKALSSGYPVLPVFVFDENILSKLSAADRRVAFINESIKQINTRLHAFNSMVLTRFGKPENVIKKLLTEFKVVSVYANEDYEPYGIQRDRLIEKMLESYGISLQLFKDHVIAEVGSVLKPDGTPYVVFTPFSKKWKEMYPNPGSDFFDSGTLLKNVLPIGEIPAISLQEFGFIKVNSGVQPFDIGIDRIKLYEETRNFPALEATSMIGPHLRFGTISVRACARQAVKYSMSWLNELIWREFFMHILFHFPHVVYQAFRPEYDRIEWRNNESEFEKWCRGETGYPMVDAGMRQLNQTGFLHNRVRMVTASFLCKHLLIDWRWGEAYFAEKLNDFELSSNNGNWQWAAGSGCDAAPYFRIFNPAEQQKKFDPHGRYIQKWIPEIKSLQFPVPIVEHAFARERCLKTYKKALQNL